jgi:hypothetical protein
MFGCPGPSVPPPQADTISVRPTKKLFRYRMIIPLCGGVPLGPSCCATRFGMHEHSVKPGSCLREDFTKDVDPHGHGDDHFDLGFDGVLPLSGASGQREQHDEVNET